MVAERMGGPEASARPSAARSTALWPVVMASQWSVRQSGWTLEGNPD